MVAASTSLFQRDQAFLDTPQISSSCAEPHDAFPQEAQQSPNAPISTMHHPFMLRNDHFPEAAKNHGHSPGPMPNLPASAMKPVPIQAI